MKKHIQIIILAFCAVLLSACGTVPEKAPEPPVTATDAASAIMAADVAIGEASQRNNLWRDTAKIFAQADSAMAANEYKKARDLANRAREQAEMSVIQSYRADAQFLITSLRKDYMDQMYADQKTRLESAESALDSDRVKVAYDTASLIMAELQAQIDEERAPEPMAEMEPTPEPTGQLNAYTVNRKDNLWDIAAKPEVYGNADMWPLLWKANKDKIKRPDEVATGLNLVIDRSASEESVAAAIKYSKLRGAPSLGPVDAFDQKYLGK